jgi:hypothetical protein
MSPWYQEPLMTAAPIAGLSCAIDGVLGRLVGVTEREYGEVALDMAGLCCGRV